MSRTYRKALAPRALDLWWRAGSTLWPNQLDPTAEDVAGIQTAEFHDTQYRIITLTDAKVVGEARLLVTAANRVIANMQGLFGVEHPGSHHFLNPKLRLPKHLPGNSFLIAGATEPNYYHWLFDCLPRLEIAHRAGVDLGSFNQFLVMRRPPKFVTETLLAFGIRPDQLVPTHSREVLQCDQLTATELPTPFDHFPGWVIDFLKRSINGNHQLPPFGRRLYLSRRDARSRRVVNEDELFAALSPMGFERVTLGGLSVAEQVSAFSQAELVVAPHGAGLTNILFAAPGTTIFELYDPAYDVRCFESLSRTLGHVHHRVTCQPADPQSDQPAQEQDLRAPVASLVEAIRGSFA